MVRRSTGDGQSSVLFCSFFAKSSIAAQLSGGSARRRETNRLRKDSSASDMRSLTRIASSSLALRRTYISPTPSRSHASETQNTRQMWSDNLTSWFSAMIDEKVMNTIRQATYPSFYPNANLVTAKITRPSVRELNFRWTYQGGTYDGAPLEYFLTHSAIMPWTGSSTEADYWTRSKSPRNSSSEAVYVSHSGVASQRASGSNARARPLFIFEPDTLVKKVSDGVYQLA